MQKEPRILVVDDKSQNRLLISEYLEPLNVHIEEAASGLECLEKLKNNDYTLVIMDVQMPGLSGFQVLEKMRKDPQFETIPVVFVSAVFNSEENIVKGIEIGAIDFIPKPINVNILQNKVNNYLKLYEKQKALDALVKKLEETNKRLEDSERKFKRITQSASDAIIVLDKDHFVRFWNKSATVIFGYSRYEILSENFIINAIAASSHDEFRRLITSLLNSNESTRSNSSRLLGRKKTGEEFPIELSLAYFLNTNAEVNLTVVVRDITKRMMMEKEALKAKELRESNQVMKDFMDSVSHELRTPMNAILGISNMLLSYNSENLHPDQREGLEIINQSGTRLLEMINDVLDISRLEAKKVTVNYDNFDLDKFLAPLHSMVISLIGQKPIKFHIHKSANTPRFIYSDSRKLNQILTNLLGNAVKFTSQGRINLFVHRINDKLYFEVSDTGIGIAKEHLEEIFDKFRQIDNSATKEYQGTGLGLNICKNLVNLMGGEIRADSIPESGTTIKFFLPEQHNQHNEDQKQLTGSELGYNISQDNIDSKLALVIESERDSCYWYANLLRNWNYNSIWCTNSEKAIKIINAYLPDIVLIKMEMPGIHGITLLKSMDRNMHLNTIPVIAITHTNEEPVVKVKNPTILLHEPVYEADLGPSLEQILKNNKLKLVTSKLFLYEGKNHLKNFITKEDECYENNHFLSSLLILARRSISSLFIDDMDLAGENYKIIQWLIAHSKYMPERIVVISGKPFTDQVMDTTNVKGIYFLLLSEVKKFDSLDIALNHLI